MSGLEQIQKQILNILNLKDVKDLIYYLMNGVKNN